jgi:CheY-like chemotaxis protein
LPLLAAERLPALPTPPPRKDESAEALKVLVVDDNQATVESMLVLLHLWGHEGCAAYDGPGALESVKEFQPDVVLLDLGLPLMDGFEVARRLRSQPGLEEVRLIALTGYGAEAAHERLQEAGFDLHLIKPVDPKTLEAVLRQHEPVAG